MAKTLIIVTVVVVFLILGILAIVLVTQVNFSNPKTNLTSENMTKLFIRGFSVQENNYTDINYSLEYDGITFKEGYVTADAFQEVDAPMNKTYHLYCWNDKYYTRQLVSIVGTQEDPTKMVCQLNQRIGNVNVSYSKNITSNYDKIYLNISTPDHLQKLTLCLGWSTGVIDATIPEQLATCQGVWVNWTEYDPISKNYTFLQESYPNGEGFYRCPADNEIVECEFALGTSCRLKGNDIPDSLKSKADSCYYLGDDIENSSKEVELTVRMLDYRSSLDYVDVFVLDQDRVKISNDRYWGWKYFTEYNGNNLGNKNDPYLRIPYTGENVLP